MGLLENLSKKKIESLFVSHSTIERLLNKPKYETKPPYRMWEMWKHTGWGDSIRWFDIDKMQILGHISNPKIKIGDEIRCKSEQGKTMQFVVVSIEYKYDPSDMFFAQLSYAGYVD